MVVGQSGLGKSTFLHQIHQDYHPHLSLNTPITETMSIHEIGSFYHEARHGSYDFHLMDSRGYGDKENIQVSE